MHASSVLLRAITLAFAVASLLASNATAQSADVPCPLDETYPNGIGTLVTTYKEVKFWRRDEMDAFAPAPRGMILCSYDTIVTSKEGRARVEFFTDDPKRGPSIVNIGPDTHVKMGRYANPFTDVNGDHTLIDLIRGRIRRFMKHINHDAAFSVRTGTSICGSRATTYYVTVSEDRSSTSTVVEEGLVACERPGYPGEALIGSGEGIEIGFDALGEVFEVTGEVLAVLAESVDARDGWTPGAKVVNLADPAAIAGLPLPGASALPAACKTPVTAGAGIPTYKYKFCDPTAGTQYASCAIAYCITEARTEEMKRERPALVFEKMEATCRPVCDKSAGFKWLDFLGHGGFCGKCEAGTRFDRGLGCCR